MIKLKYILGNYVKYNGEKRRILGIRFTAGGVMYKLSGIIKWINESEV